MGGGWRLLYCIIARLGWRRRIRKEGKEGRTFEERDEVDEVGPLLLLTLPFREDDPVLWLQLEVLRVRVDHDDLGEVAVQVRQVLVGRVGSDG